MTLKERNEQIQKSLYLYRKTGDIEHYKDVGRIMEWYRKNQK